MSDDGAVGERGGKGDGRVSGEAGDLEMGSHDGKGFGDSKSNVSRRQRCGIGRGTSADKNVEGGLSKGSDLGEGGTGGDLLDTTKEGTEVSGGDGRVSDELDKVTDNDTGHSLSVGGTFLEGTGQKGDHDGKSGTVDFSDESGGRKTFDGGGNCGRGSHGRNEEVNMLEHISVGKDTTKSGGSFLSGGRDLTRDKRMSASINDIMLTSALVSCIACSTTGMTVPNSLAT